MRFKGESLIEQGRYRYEIVRGGEVVAVEEAVLGERELECVRRAGGGMSRYEARASLDEQGRVVRVTLRYTRGPFSRNATYQVSDEFLRGNVSAMGALTVATAKLGRFREVDAGLAIFRALIIAHVRERGQTQWTGRVAIIDPDTLVPASHKQTCRQKDTAGLLWSYETRMGDSEEITFDERGRLLRLVDSRGLEVRLTADQPVG